MNTKPLNEWTKDELVKGLLEKQYQLTQIEIQILQAELTSREEKPKDK